MAQPPAPPLWANPQVIAGVVSFCVAVAVSFVVALAIGPWRASREEAARRDRVTRWRVARHLKTLRLRVVQERRRREQRTRGETQVIRRDPLTIFAFEHEIWPAVALLDDPTISGRVKRRVRSRLIGLLGAQRVEYLESLLEAPAAGVQVSGVTTRLTESRVLEDGLDALVDRMMTDDSAASAQAVVCQLDHVIRLLS